MFGRLTPLVKNLLIINIGLFFISYFFLRKGISLNDLFGLYYIGDPAFKPFQFVTYMFFHQVIVPGKGLYLWHIFGNMFALFIFGPLLEQFLGQKKFLILYMVAGVGAGLFYTGVNYWEVRGLERDYESYIANPSPGGFVIFISEHADGLSEKSKSMLYNHADSYERNPNNYEIIAQSKKYAYDIYRMFGTYSMVGASGAVFGILAAFALFFPNTELFLLFIPFPIKAKYLVTVYILYEVFAELQRAPGDNVAHLAHIGGALIAFFMVRYWKKQRRDFY
ncbi:MULTISPECIES: rhomboid family intramembrane serine protease [Roseivirga]|uniref:Rhomboid family intramembrane serine protease n=1 Tax=Roseivirga thermotolerans TaxID=1758176 RepID=A0ABQ3I0W1_9BACT|nr:MULTISPECIES: rhomboid family intramembrane serine protease [Roseivirga]MEC7752963.1 rhomboid family intramembrane serine protease [Bacteroidota bacterium]GHE52886.1 rhomboid family intramembrane serine protease [Roseivirga thermotolerans]